MRLADYIRNDLETLLQEWEKYAKTIHSPIGLNRNELRDHAEEMLRAIANDLELPESEQQKFDKSRGLRDFTRKHSFGRDESASQHGLGRLQSGFGIEGLVSEFRALRASVLRCWQKAQRTGTVESDFADMYRFNEAIDQALAESISSYVSEKERQARLFESIHSSAPDHSCVLDLSGRVIYANRAMELMLNLPLSALKGKYFFDFVTESPEQLYHEICQIIQTKQSLHTELSFHDRPGTYEYIFFPVLAEDGTVESITGAARNISERKAKDEEIWRSANYDLLTGLPNRRLFYDRLEQEINHAERTGSMIALLFIDLDHFKEANDMLGHDAGDILLRQTADRLHTCIRKQDTVARLGGDEFTIILANIEHFADVETVAKKTLKELARNFSILRQNVHLSASIGITLYPRDASTTEHLIRNADQAMYAAKNAGRNCFAVYTDEMQKGALVRLRLITELRQAISQNQLAVFYQPIIDLTNGKTSKAEALVRWQHPQMGWIPPREFIGLAEEIGVISEISNWVFTKSVSNAEEWRKSLGGQFQISVNISPFQFMERKHGLNWIEYFKHIVLDSNSVSIEITESVFLNSEELNVMERLADLKKIGIQLAIDDFGTGYSSLSYLRKFDIDYLKIDQSFVHDMTSDESSRAIAEAIIAMGHKLGLKVIAEGVETEEQRDWLKNFGCDYAQGFLFSMPLPEQEFVQRYVH
ncbi:EAL domain-containing protein [Oxalobacteraceae bacterium R-40]|uniref:EAL domain-containing protein n=1 Tax=Keguizhuia sedimenti TaxID=3064264 RepID=A0ABU1BTP7_9BURK|nr:EAL domain-containing protein [Oxalobacteraceae bacterium R-40]